MNQLWLMLLLESQKPKWRGISFHALMKISFLVFLLDGLLVCRRAA